MPSMPSTNSAIAAAQRIIQTVQDEAGIAELIQAGDARTARLSAFNRQNIIRTQLVHQTWKHIGRQVLAMHPEVVDEVRVATSDTIPGEVLRTLPYMNPLVVFADPPEFDTWLAKKQEHPLTGMREAKMRLVGFFTYGTGTVGINEPATFDDEIKQAVRVEQRIYSTSDSEADRLGMMLVFEALNEDGQVIDVEFNSISLFFDKNQNLAETVDDLLTRFHWETGIGPEHKDYKRARRWMRSVFSVVVGSLFYLCSTTLEAEKVPPKTVAKHMGRSISRKPLSLYKVGWTTGTALSRYRASRSYSTSEMGDITHQQDPQHRRSHFKMQPYGPGKSLRKLIFVSAYWTHRERLGEEGVNTAHSVPRVNGKGSARESVESAMSMVDVRLEQAQ